EFDQIAISETQRYIPAPPERSQSIIKLQIIMDRAGISPGVIDGLQTARFRKALAAFNQLQKQAVSITDLETIDQLLMENGGPAFVDYAITHDDVHYEFTPQIPHRYVEQASMGRIDFKSVQEMLAERFHMDQTFLTELNAGADFGQAGTIIRVASFGKDLQKHVSRIEADKTNLQLRAFSKDGSLVASYPASIGSQRTPSPTGTHSVRNKAQNPAYTYDPNGSSQPGQTKGLLLLPPGPNGPVGDAWIGLSQRTYGIHGTSEPSQIGIAQSVGCIRLTNWDALELARLVKRGVKVTFIE
ncbi:MAG: L,D-transpeptidase, partial [Pseudomonadota bacterium]